MRLCQRYMLGFLPLSVGLLMSLGTLTTYIISTSTEHVEPLLPSISDTGIHSPERFVFSQFINVVAGLSIVTFLIRFKMIQDIAETLHCTTLYKLNYTNCALGVIASFGLSMVGNCQYDTAMIAHLIGAVLVFSLGNVYCFLDTFISFRASPKYISRLMCWMRLVLSILGTVTFVITVVGTLVENRFLDFYGDNPIEERLHWSPEHKGYGIHLASSFSEWIMGSCFVGFFFSVVPEFRRSTASVKAKMSPLMLDQSEELGEKAGHESMPFTHCSSGNEMSKQFS